MDDGSENERGRKMTRTIENCSLIRKGEKTGIGVPDRLYYINKCEGYLDAEEGKPCHKCKKCKYFLYKEDIK